MSKARKNRTPVQKRPTFARPPKHSGVRAVERMLKWNRRGGRGK